MTSEHDRFTTVLATLADNERERARVRSDSRPAAALAASYSHDIAPDAPPTRDHALTAVIWLYAWNPRHEPDIPLTAACGRLWESGTAVERRLRAVAEARTWEQLLAHLHGLVRLGAQHDLGYDHLALADDLVRWQTDPGAVCNEWARHFGRAAQLR